MTEPAASAPAENVSRGLALTVLVIPLAIIAYAIVGSLLGIGFIIGIVAITIPTFAALLYRTGAGAPLSAASRVPWTVIAVIAVVLGIFAGIVAGTWKNFTAVGGDGGILGSAFLTTLGRQFTTNLGDNLVPLAIGVGLGLIGINGVLRGPRTPSAGFGGNRLTPEQTDALTGETDDAVAQDAATLAPPAPPISNTPSPGIMLNGKPYDPDKK